MRHLIVLAMVAFMVWNHGHGADYVPDLKRGAGFDKNLTISWAWIKGRLPGMDAVKTTAVEKAMKEATEYYGRLLKIHWDPMHTSVLNKTPTAAGCLINKLHGHTNCNDIITKNKGHLTPYFHFWIQTSVVTTRSQKCGKGESTLASCGVEQRINGTKTRPISGVITFCSLRVDEKLHLYLLATTKHEMAHALFMGGGFFGDHFKKDPTMTQVSWKIAGGVQPTLKKYIPTESKAASELKKFTQSYYNCKKDKWTEGIFAENYGKIGGGSEGAHLSKKVYGSELMTSIIDTGENDFTMFSGLVAFSTGFYTVETKELRKHWFGKNMGCDFLSMGCRGFLENNPDKADLTEGYCLPKESEEKDKEEKTELRCDAGHRSVLSCKYKYGDQCKPRPPYNSSAFSYPPQYWKHACFTGDFTGCSSWKAGKINMKLGEADKAMEYRMCEEEVTKDAKLNFRAEVFGGHSACFVTGKETGKQIQKKPCTITNTPFSFDFMGAGCYEYRCHEGRLQIKPFSDSDNKERWLTCWAEGAHLRIRRKIHDGKNAYRIAGDIICPSCESFCDSPEQRPKPNKTPGFKGCDPDIPNIETTDWINPKCGAADFKLSVLARWILATAVAIAMAKLR